MHCPMRAQALSAKRTHESEIGGLPRQASQATYVGEAVQRPQPDLARYGYDFFLYFQRQQLPSQGIALSVSAGRGSSLERLLLGFAYFKHTGQTRELQYLKNGAAQSK